MNATPTLGASVLTADGAGEVFSIEPTISADIDLFHVHTQSGVSTYYADELIFLP